MTDTELKAITDRIERLEKRVVELQEQQVELQEQQVDWSYRLYGICIDLSDAGVLTDEELDEHFPEMVYTAEEIEEMRRPKSLQEQP